MESNPASLEEKAAELAEAVRLIRERVRARHPSGDARPFSVPLADLTPVLHARDAASAKVASIGTVNPRPPGALNTLAQAFKKLLARSLNWYVREQVEFNRASLAYMEAALEALNEENRALSELAAAVSERSNQAERRLEVLEQALGEAQEKLTGIGALDAKIDTIEANLKALIEQTAEELEAGFAVNLKKATDELSGEAGELKDIRKHWHAWRQEWERKVAVNEMQFLRGLADLQSAFNHRATLMETNFRDITRAQHRDFEGALERSNVDIQKRLWDDMERIRAEYERVIHTELRIIRQRAIAQAAAGLVVAPPPAAPASVESDSGNIPGFDPLRFADRFRGTEEYILRYVDLYTSYFEGRKRVLDAGCGRGELLAALSEAGIGAAGIDSNLECVSICRDRGLNVEAADLFPYLDGLAEGELDGLVCAQVVEHLPAARLPEFIALASRALARGGRLAIETPNPECLAIFATHFYLDPTHTRPVPAPLLAYYLEENRFGFLRVEKLSPALETIPALAELPESFRKTFFDGQDYVIFAERL